MSNQEDRNKRPQQTMMRGPRHQFSMQKEKPKNFKQTMKRLLKYLASSRALFVGMILVATVYTLSNLYSNVLIKNVISSLGTFNVDTMTFTTNPDASLFQTSLILLVMVYIIYVSFQYLSTLFGAFLSTKMVRLMRNDLFHNMVRLPVSYIDKHPHGDLMSRMTNDIDNISQAVTSSLTSLISGILTITGSLAIMIWYSPLLTLVSIVVLLLTLLLTTLISKYVRPLYKKQQAVLGSLNTQTEEMVTGNKTVMAYNHQHVAMEEFNQRSNELTKVGIKAQIIGSSMGPMMNFVGNIGYFLVSILGSLFILKGIGNTLMGEPLTIAIVIMFLSTTKQFTRPINEIAQLYASLLTAFAGAERVFEVLDEETELLEAVPVLLKEQVKGEIDFQHISFGYNQKQKVLKDFNLDIRSGHKIALVGATGSGKTTIVNLLLRFYDIDEGDILIDGHSIFSIPKQDLRSMISIVLQDPVLFGDSILNNVKYANETATEEEINRALTLANCNTFIEQLPNGLNTILTEDAHNISEGQRQLITIARAILADPKILILDEATSSVDTRTEKHIQDAMIELMKNRTSIIIAHRLSTIRDANLIVVLEQGEVAEMGNHQELIAQKGIYYSLYQTQFKGLEI